MEFEAKPVEVRIPRSSSARDQVSYDPYAHLMSGTEGEVRRPASVHTPLIAGRLVPDYSPPLARPIVSYVILLSCTACFVFEIEQNGWSFESFSVNPMFGPSVDTLITCGEMTATSLAHSRHSHQYVTYL